jgi:hypothetical protein
VVDTLTKVVEAIDRAGIELISDNTVSGGGGRGVRFKEPKGVNTTLDKSRTAPPPDRDRTE